MRSGWRLSAALGLAAVGGAGLIVAACALNKEGLGPPDASLEDSGTDTQPPMDAPSETASDATDAPAEVSEAMALCLSGCTMEGGVCEGDAGEQCSVYCTTQNPCQSVRCPPGIPCFVDCTGDNSCTGGVDCSEASSCATLCGGAAQCGAISCGGTDCTVQCQAPGSCANTIDCKATDSCTVECFGANACGGAIHSAAQHTSVSCQQPGTCAQGISCGGAQCQVYCSGSGSCAGGECCDAATCNPRAPQNCP